LVLQNFEHGELELPGLTVENIDLADNLLRFDLDLTVFERDDGLILQWHYKKALFNAASIEAMADALTALSDAVLNNPQCPIAELSLLAPSQQQVLLQLSHGPLHSDQRQHSVVERFFTSASRQPQSLALAQGGAGLSYQQLATKAARVAAYLAEQEFGPGQRIGLLCQPSLALHIALLGIMRSGAAYVPLPAGGGAQRLQHMIDDAGLELVLVESALLGELPVAGLDVLLLDEAVSDEAWLAEYDEAELPALPQADDLAYVIYTSGSTGTPKGVMVSHRGLTDYCAYALGEYYGEVDGSLVVTAHAFDITVPSLYLPLLNGGVVELPGSDDPLSLLAQRLSAGERNYLLRLTPLHVQGLLSLLGDTTELTAAHVFVVGGEAFPPALAQTLQQVFPHSQIYNHYGPSEAVVGCALFDVSGWLRAGVERLPARLPIGRPMANTVLYVVDENAQLLPPGVPGELLIGGVGLSCGYLNRAELTAAKFIANPFADERAPRVYRSGDLARWNSAGELEFIGRVDDQIKVRGYRIEPGEIESLLKADERVGDALVIARGEGGDKRLLAYVLGDADDEQLGASLRTALSQRLPSYMVPLAVQVLVTWPLNANGKLDRRA
ncbi:MAG TPA: amino acid adenylation domain-containing protein, partial [Kiloniellaceae bacterium]|nr:amino acid adenylation domain-containing protein [Kiloniellaceae bacterium]